MSINKIVVPGFGIGSAYGTPATIALAQTSTVTLTGTVLPAGQYLMTGLVTGTFAILNGAPGHVVYDGVSGTLVYTTTSVSIVVIST